MSTQRALNATFEYRNPAKGKKRCKTVIQCVRNGKWYSSEPCVLPRNHFYHHQGKLEVEARQELEYIRNAIKQL